MNNPNFSVVTSFFGENPTYVLRLYDSIIKQKVNWEWVVTDDFSDNLQTKETLLEIIKKDSRVKYIEQKYKREIFRDPQKYASGLYVFHIDADDLVHPNYLQHVQYWFDKFPNVKCILSGSEFIDEDGWFHRFFIHREEKLKVFENYLGRVWRNGYNFDFEKIFTNPEEIIRMNDMFLVRSFEKDGDILCLPRSYIKYEVRKKSNSNINRNQNEINVIDRVKKEFELWVTNTSLESPYEPYFFDMENDVIPILPLEWNTNIKTIHFQYEIPNYKKRKLRELYSDYELSFGEWDKIEDPDYKIFNSLENTNRSKINSKGNIVFCDAEDNNTFEFYKNELHQKGKGFNWFKLWDYCWIVSK